MTTPTEQSIRKACEEAGVPYASEHVPFAHPAILALARRIEAEAVACSVCGIANQNHWIHSGPFDEQCHDYATPQPDRVKELEARATAAEAKVEEQEAELRTLRAERDAALTKLAAIGPYMKVDPAALVPQSGGLAYKEPNA